MRFVVEASHLQRALSFVNGCIPNKSTLPIVQHVLLCAAGSTLTVRAMNVLREAEISCPAQVEDSLLFTLPGKLLCALVSGFSSGAQVGFTRKANNLIEMTCGSSKSTMRSFEPQDFPALKTYLGDAPIGFDVDPKALVSLLSSVAYASEKDVLIRPDFYGVHLYADGGKLIALGSDVNRLSRREMVCPPGAEAMTASILVGGDNVQEVISTLKEIGEPLVNVRVGPSVIEFATETSRLTSGLGGKELPPQFRISSKAPGLDFSVHPGEFRRAVEHCQQVYVHASQKIDYKEARLVAKDGKLTITMGDGDMDTIREEIEATVTEAKSLSIRVPFLVEMLRHWPEDGDLNVCHAKVGVYFSSPKHPDFLAMVQVLRAKRKIEAEAA